MMDDPTRNVDTIIDQYFVDMYGPASAPMESFYKLIENTYNDRAVLPA